MPKRGSPDSGVPRNPGNRAHGDARGPHDRGGYSPPRRRRVRPVLRALHRQGPRGRPAAHARGPSRETQRLLAGLSDAKALHRYAAGKWSIKEVIGHVADTERVYAYRALRFARADATALPGFDENAWVPAGSFDARSLADLACEPAAVRPATLPP